MSPNSQHKQSRLLTRCRLIFKCFEMLHSGCWLLLTLDCRIRRKSSESGRSTTLTAEALSCLPRNVWGRRQRQIASDKTHTKAICNANAHRTLPDYPWLSLPVRLPISWCSLETAVNHIRALLFLWSLICVTVIFCKAFSKDVTEDLTS